MKTILVDAYNTFVTEQWTNKEMHVLLEKFLNKKIILTNANPEKQVEFGLVNLPYEMFSWNFDPLKSDPEYYQIMLEQFKLNVKDIVYFEHSSEAVETARSLWIVTYHYDKDQKDLAALEKFLNENL